MKPRNFPGNKMRRQIRANRLPARILPPKDIRIRMGAAAREVANGHA